MVTLMIGNVYSRLVSSDVAVVHAVADRLAVPVVGAKYTKWFKSGKWDGRHRFLERPNNRFLTGLLPIVRATLLAGRPPILRFTSTDAGIAFTEDDRRERPTPMLGFPAWFGPPLRDYQERVVTSAGKASRGIIRVGTGGGKTVIAGKLIADLRAPTLFLVHRKELAEQTVDRFSEWFCNNPIGILGLGYWNPQAITVAMIQTLYARLKSDPKTVRAFLNSRQLVIADEGHRVGADSWSKVLQWTPAYYRFGMSGTPLVDNDVRDLTLQGLTGGLIADVSAAELAEAGWLAKPVCRFLAYDDGQDGAGRGMTYQDAYQRLIVENRGRSGLAAGILAKHPGSQVLFIVKRIQHGENLRAALGRQISFVSGQEPDDLRQTIYAGFRSGAIRLLIASTIYDEGVDFPALDVVVNLAGGKTVVSLFQRLGRAMHREDTSQPIYYYDFRDEGNRYLNAHYLRRLRELQKAGFKVIKETSHAAD